MADLNDARLQPSFDAMSRATQNMMVGNLNPLIIPNQLRGEAQRLNRAGIADKGSLLTMTQQINANFRGMQPTTVNYAPQVSAFNEASNYRWKQY